MRDARKGKCGISQGWEQLCIDNNLHVDIMRLKRCTKDAATMHVLHKVHSKFAISACAKFWIK
jgi:hypothetical protein